jgi:uncharacterized membrane protein (DUF106 family)
MNAKKDLTDYKRRYNLFRHHAWAGLGFLSVLLAVRILFPELLELLQPILVVLISYVVIALLFTYKYRAGLSAKQEVVHHSKELEKEKIHADVEKELLKMEKKKTKAKIKSEKKLHKT